MALDQHKPQAYSAGPASTLGLEGRFYCCRGTYVHVYAQLHCAFSRYHYVGLMVLLFHDIGDVMLEFAKILVYFKELGGQKYHFFKLSADIAFGCFAIQWLVQQRCCRNGN